MKSTANRALVGIGGILLLAWGMAQPQTTVRMEAEDMQLDTYRIELLDFASNGALINLKGEGFVGTATAPFPGIGGEYDISVVYHDENDGLAQLTVSINDREVDSWTLDERVKGGEQPIEANRFTREIATGYAVATGDEITINGLQGNWDHANVDYIEFVPAGEPTLGEAIVLDFTDPDDCVIDEPGYYVLDRSWDLGDTQSGVICTTFEIDAIEITLDLRGFEIRGVPEIPVLSPGPRDMPSLCGGGGRVGKSYFPLIRNGSVIGNPDAVECADGFVRLENLYVQGSIQAHHLTVIGSEISNGSIMTYGCDSDGCGPSNLANNRMVDCREDLCANIRGGSEYPNLTHGNYFEGCVISDGLGDKITGNVFHMNQGAQCSAIGIGGTGATISWNTVEGSGTQGAGIRVGAFTTSVVVEGNIIRNFGVGIDFTGSTGNFFGNNRVSAPTPFGGTDGQTDWGGNVSF
jgi:parallel beta-helix repeat protein